MSRPFVALAILLCSASLVACTAADASRAPADRPPVDPDVVTVDAYFAGGCFWGVEHYMQQLDGVVAVDSGYMGGHVERPSYEDVSSQTSGHLETVRVRFDPKRVSYDEVAKRFFEIHDPTQADGQGPDLGPEYLSAVFFSTPEQKASAEELVAQLRARGYDVTTQIRPAETFWIAEGYHQDYYARAGKQPYCHARVKRFDTPVVNGRSTP